MQTPTLRDWLANVQSDPTFAKGETLQQHIDDLEEQVGTVNLQEPVDMPNLPVLILTAVMALGVVVGIRALRPRKSIVKQAADATTQRCGLALVCGVLVVVYVVALAIDVNRRAFDFPAATLTFVIAIGLCLARNRLRAVPSLLGLAVLLAFGLAYLLTQVFVIDLP